MKSILDIVHRSPAPAPWAEGDNIPWDNPAFSERMLAEHLSQDHDLASRRSETIDRQVEWIFSNVLGSRPGRVLDLGCGPGLYANRLARLGCECVGIDFSPASIRHARNAAAEDGLSSVDYRHADLRDGDFGDGFDLAMLVYGQFNVFPRDRGLEVLTNTHAALNRGGAMLLEIQSPELIEQGGKQAASWYSAPSGLFSDRPHLVLQENFWDADARASTTRFMVIDGASGAVSNYALSNEAYTDQDLGEALRASGFEAVERFPSLYGEATKRAPDLPAILARR